MPPGPQAPRQAELAGEQLRNLRGDGGRPAGACGRLAGRGHRSADRTLLGRQRLPRPRARRVEQLQARQRQPGRCSERLQERQVEGAYQAAVEAAAHHQHPEDVRPRTGRRHDHVGARLGDPGRFIGRQQGEDRRPPVRLDPHGSTGRFQQVDDGRLARQGHDPGLRGAEPARAGLGVVRHQQSRGRAAPAPHRPGDGLADGGDPPGLRQSAHRVGQHLPLVLGLGEDPGVQADQDAFTGGDHQQQDAHGREQRLRQRIRDDGAHRTLRAAPDEPRQRPGGHGGHRPQQAGAQQQPAVERPHRLPQVGNTHRQHRVPEQDQPGKAQRLYHQDRRRPAVIGDPVPGREHLGHVVGGRHAHEQEEPRAEHHDAPHLVGRRRPRAQRDQDDRPQHQQVLRGDRAIEHQRDRRRSSARPRQLQRDRAGQPETATDHHAGRDHATRQIIEPGPAMDPRALASERPQEGRREQERGNYRGQRRAGWRQAGVGDKPRIPAAAAAPGQRPGA